MSNFLTINGIPLPVFRDSLVESDVDVGEGLKMTPTGIVVADRTMKMRKWTGRTNLLSTTQYNAIVRLVEGFGASWSFDVTAISAQGFTKSVASTFSIAAGGKFGGKLSVGSGFFFGAQMKYRMGVLRAAGWDPAVDGYTLICWRNFVASETASAGFHHVILSGKTDFVQGAAANPSGVSQFIDGVLNNSAKMGNCFAVSLTSPFVALHGKTTNNASSAIDFDDFVFLPFVIDPAWAPFIFAFHNATPWSALPYLTLGGDFLTNAGGTAKAVGRINRHAQMFASGDNNQRELDFEFWESL